MGNAASEPQSLKEEVENILQESRVVVPGIEALFGFQLIVVFSNGFIEMDYPVQLIHLVSLLFIGAAIALIMAPAAYHRVAERGRVSRYFAELASKLIAWAMVALLAGISLDVFVVVLAILKNTAASAAIAAATAVLFAGLWFGFPVLRRKTLTTSTPWRRQA